MVWTLFFLGTAFFAFAEARAAPARYVDQRQDGDFNLYTQLKDLLFVVVIPSNPDISMALNALEHVAFRSKEESIKSDETVRQEEPYSVEILQINENHPDKESLVRKAEGGDAGTLNVSDQRPSPGERIARNVKNFEFPKSREVLPVIPGYFVNTLPKKTLGSKTGTSRARNVVGNPLVVWNPDIEPGRPGTSLKKQLLERVEEDVALPSSNADVSSFVKEKQELVLLGGGIENCGPGSHRDASGICQVDKSIGSPL